MCHTIIIQRQPRELGFEQEKRFYTDVSATVSKILRQNVFQFWKIKKLYIKFHDLTCKIVYQGLQTEDFTIMFQRHLGPYHCFSININIASHCQGLLG